VPGQPGSDVTGSGLGLMIVREIVEAHGGSVGVESRVGIGSRFWIRLPSASGPTASPPS
jgi:signal transduction histidine kinase